MPVDTRFWAEYQQQPVLLRYCKTCGHYEDCHVEVPKAHRRRYGRVQCRGALGKECNCTEFKEVE